MLNYKEALDKIFEQISSISKTKELVKLDDSLGRILAEDVISDIYLPPFNNSAMDGYAIKYQSDMRCWAVVDEISAGNYKDVSIDTNCSVSIMTGAKLPEGYDTVIPIEDCIFDGNTISVTQEYKLKKGNNTRLMGEDLLQGSIAIPVGKVLKSNNISIAAACGKSSICVYSKLKVGVFATGDELVSVDTIPTNDQIRSSNLDTIIASIKEMNMIPVDFGIISDKQELIENQLMKALNYDIDILITTGGVSVGKFDFMQNALKSIVAEIQFWKVNIKPGKPFLFSIFNKNEGKTIPIFSLPGNPVSSYVNFIVFVRKAIQRVYGLPDNDVFFAKLNTPIKKNDNKLHFVLAKCKFDFENKYYEAEIAGSQSSGKMSTMSNSDCLIFFPEELNELSKGAWVKCMKI